MNATRLQTGKLELDLAPLDLGPLVARTVEMVQVLAQGQTITYATPTKPVMVTGDAGRLEQVVVNLLTNAITHAPGTERIDVSLHSDDRTAAVIVRDVGPGIPVEALETIFGRFVQVNPHKRPGRAGLGLGLYIAREIIEAHGGTITADSAPGEGATFMVRLPLLKDARQRDP